MQLYLPQLIRNKVDLIGLVSKKIDGKHKIFLITNSKAPYSKFLMKFADLMAH